MSSLNITPGSLSKTGEQLDAERPVAMVNLLRFAEHANYSDGTTCSGLEAYREYSRHTWPLLQGVGGEVVYHGAVAGMLIAPQDEHWDEVLIVKYPALSDFLKMVKSDEYGGIVHHRMAALDDSRLMATQSKRE